MHFCERHSALKCLENGFGWSGIWIPNSLYLNACVCIPLPWIFSTHSLNCVSRESLPKALQQEGLMTFSPWPSNQDANLTLLLQDLFLITFKLFKYALICWETVYHQKTLALYCASCCLFTLISTTFKLCSRCPPHSVNLSFESTIQKDAFCFLLVHWPVGLISTILLFSFIDRDRISLPHVPKILEWICCLKVLVSLWWFQKVKWLFQHAIPPLCLTWAMPQN